MKESFILYTNQYKPIRKMNLEQKGKLLDAIFMDALGEEPDFGDDIAVEVAFSFIKERIDANNERYEDIKQKRREAGLKGNQSRWKKSQITNDNFANDNESQNIAKHRKNSKCDISDICDSQKSLTDNVNDNDIIKKNDISKDISQKEKKSDVLHDILQCWNNLIDSHHSIMPRIQTISSQRETATMARYREHGLMKVYDVLELAVKSDFLNGKNDKGWKANFDWVMKPNNFVKILEGNYNNNESKNAIITQNNGQLQTYNNSGHLQSEQSDKLARRMEAEAIAMQLINEGRRRQSEGISNR